MKEKWLNGIAVMFVHKHIPVDRKKNLQMWDSTGDRRVELAFNKIDIKKLKNNIVHETLFAKIFDRSVSSYYKVDLFYFSISIINM